MQLTDDGTLLPLLVQAVEVGGLIAMLLAMLLCSSSKAC